MTAISDSSAISLARSFEAVQRPDIPEVDVRDAFPRDDGGMTDCFPIPPDVHLPGGESEQPEGRLPDDGDFLPIPEDRLPGDGGCFPMPEDREPFIDENGRLGWRTVVNGTSGDDTIQVTYNLDGSADVTVNGETTHYSSDEAENMRINGGAGNDTIVVQDNRLRLGEEGSVTIEGGSGDDNISGDFGRVDADGGTGSDTINGLPEFDFELPVKPLPDYRDPGDEPVYIPL